MLKRELDRIKEKAAALSAAGKSVFENGPISNPGPHFAVRMSILDTNGRLSIFFEETAKNIKERERLRVEIPVFKNADFSDFDQRQIDFEFFETDQTIPKPLKDYGLFEMSVEPLERAGEFVLEILETTTQEAAGVLTIPSERRQYLRECWQGIQAQFKQVFRGKVTPEKLDFTQKNLYESHKIGLQNFVKDREKRKAPVPRGLANAARLAQAEAMGLEEITLDGKQFIPAEDMEKVRQKAEAITQSKGLETNLAMFAFRQMDGLEIPALLTLIQLVRERAGTKKGAVQNEMQRLSINRDDFLSAMGYDIAGMDRVEKSRRRKEVENALFSMAHRPISYFSEKGSQTFTAWRSGLFTFTTYEVKTEEFEVGAFKFEALSLVQVLSEDDTPFRDIPLRPFSYIIEHADQRVRGALLRLTGEILLSASFGVKNTEFRLSDFDLGSASRDANTVKKEREIILHALEVYGKGAVKIDQGVISFEIDKAKKLE